MNKNSIINSITFIFLVSIVSIVLAFLFLIEFDKQNYTNKLNDKYTIVARATLFHLNNFITQKELKEQVKDYKMTEINDKETKDTIIKNAQVIQKINSRIGASAILVYQKNNYLLIEHKDTTLLLRDDDYQPYRYYVIKIVFALVLLVIILAYILTIKKIKPLRKLKREMDKFAKGDLNISCKRDGER